jgi:hypothetical protein
MCTNGETTTHLGPSKINNLNQSPDPFTGISSFQQAQLRTWILKFHLKRKTNPVSKTICSLGITDNGQSPETQYTYPSIYEAQGEIMYPLLYMQQLLTRSIVLEKSPIINIYFNHIQA